MPTIQLGLDTVSFRHQLVEFVFSKKFAVHLAFIGLIVLAGQGGQISAAAPRSSLLYSLITGEEVIEGPLDPSAYAQVEGTGPGGARLAAIQATDRPMIGDGIGYESIEAQVDSTTLNGNAVVAPLNPLVAEPGSDEKPVSRVAPKPQIYTIQKGDTLASIAAEANVSVNTILWANSLSDRDILKEGNHLVIPPTTGVLHTVRSGDTLLAITHKYDARLAEVTEYNQLAADTMLRIGQQIMIPDGVAPAPRAPQVVPRGTRLAEVEADDGPTPAPNVEGGGGFQRPAAGYISQAFRWGHTGIDIARNGVDRSSGALPAIYAAAGGTVEFAGRLGGYGNLVVLRHPGGLTTYYAHVLKFYVRQGQEVTKGAAIAQMGSTGHSTGPHLHFEVRRAGQPVNPKTFVNF